MVFGWLFADVVVDESSPGNVPSRSIVDDFSVGVERPLLADCGSSKMFCAIHFNWPL